MKSENGKSNMAIDLNESNVPAKDDGGTTAAVIDTESGSGGISSIKRVHVVADEDSEAGSKSTEKRTRIESEAHSDTQGTQFTQTETKPVIGADSVPKAEAKKIETGLDLGAKMKEGMELEVVWQVTNDDDEDAEVLFRGVLTEKLPIEQGRNGWATFNLHYNAKDEFPASDRVVCFNETAELYDMEDEVYMQWHHPGAIENQTLSLKEIMEQQSAIETEDGGNEHDEATAAFAALPIQKQLVMAEKFRAFADNMKDGLSRKLKDMEPGGVVTKDDILDILDGVKSS